jgi:hypothetical protein
MLVARVVTSAGNVATVTPLVNRPKITAEPVRRDIVSTSLNWTDFAGSAVTLNWARLPDVALIAMRGFRSNNIDADGTPTGGGAGKILNAEIRIPVGFTRYGTANLQYFL